MIKHCDNSCGQCEHVDRGYDDCSHETFWVTARCPLTEYLTLYEKIHNRKFAIEWITSYTGCVHFKLDEEYKRWNDEIDQFLKDRHKN